jgi:hypothetical protein
MRWLRAIPGAVAWILAAVTGLLGALLCVTVIGLPLGIPLLLVARRTFKVAVQLMLPPHLAHPVKETKTSTRKTGEKVMKSSGETGKTLARKSSKAAKSAADAVSEPSASTRKAKKKAKKRARRLRKALP